MPKEPRLAKKVELAPAIYRDIEALVQQGYWLSFQEFAREALKEKLERWKIDHRLPEGPGPAGIVERLREERASRPRKPAP